MDKYTLLVLLVTVFFNGVVNLDVYIADGGDGFSGPHSAGGDGFSDAANALW